MRRPHPRWRAATVMALDTVPVIVHEITDPLEAERILIESNRQREKTPSERMREAKHIEHIVSEEAMRRMLAGKADPCATRHKGQVHTDTEVAASVDMKPTTFRSGDHARRLHGTPGARRLGPVGDGPGASGGRR